MEFILFNKRLYLIFLLFISHWAMATPKINHINHISHISHINHKVEFVGNFSSMRYTDEHAYGFEVQLWKDKKGIFGFFLSSNGLQGDTPIGKLYNLTYDATNGHLQFSAKLTLGMLLGGNLNNKPSHDLFAFDGYLKKSLLQGTLTIREMHAPQIVEKKAVTLKKTRETGDYIQSRPDYEAFFQAVKPTRGARW